MTANCAIDSSDIRELARLVPPAPGSGVELATNDLARVVRDVVGSTSRARIFDLLDDHAESLMPPGFFRSDGPPSLLEKTLLLARGTVASGVLHALDVESAPSVVVSALRAAIEEEEHASKFLDALRAGLASGGFSDEVRSFIAECIQELNNERLSRAAIRQLADMSEAPSHIVFEFDTKK